MNKVNDKSIFHRPDAIPQQIVYNDHIYKFSYLLGNSNLYKYSCKYGVRKNKANQQKCKACIGIPTNITNNNLEKSNIIVLCGDHTCATQTKLVQRLYSEAEIKKKVEHIFLNEKPRPTKAQLIAKLYEVISEETPDGEERQTFSESIVGNYYNELAKKYRINDQIFKTILMTNRNTNFELFKLQYQDKTKPGKALMIMCFCSEFQKSLIKGVTHVFIDGTFKITPPDFEQVLVILGRLVKTNVPIAYFLLPNKSQETYVKAFNMFKQETNATFRSETNYIVDFEIAEINAVKKCFMQSGDSIQLCYFHFTQSMARYFHTWPKTKITRALNRIANNLPFITEEKVHMVLTELDKHDETKKFASYFNNNYITKYKFEDWNVSMKKEKEIITNNVAENHNKTLRKHIGDHPSLDTFEQRLAYVENKHYNRWFNHKESEITTKRVTDEDFDKKFKTFIAALVKSESTHIEDQYFDDNSDDSLNLVESNSEDISDCSEEISDVPVNSSFSDDEINNSAEEVAIKENDYSNDERKNTEEAEEELNIIQNASTPQKTKIRKISNQAQQILITNIVRFNNAPPRSVERADILQSTFDEIKDIEPFIDISQVRSWFNNNKNKYK